MRDEGPGEGSPGLRREAAVGRELGPEDRELDLPLVSAEEREKELRDLLPGLLRHLAVAADVPEEPHDVLLLREARGGEDIDERLRPHVPEFRERVAEQAEADLALVRVGDLLGDGRGQPLVLAEAREARQELQDEDADAPVARSLVLVPQDAAQEGELRPEPAHEPPPRACHAHGIGGEERHEEPDELLGALRGACDHGRRRLETLYQRPADGRGALLAKAPREGDKRRPRVEGITFRHAAAEAVDGEEPLRLVAELEVPDGRGHLGVEAENAEELRGLDADLGVSVGEAVEEELGLPVDVERRVGQTPEGLDLLLAPRAREDHELQAFDLLRGEERLGGLARYAGPRESAHRGSARGEGGGRGPLRGPLL